MVVVAENPLAPLVKRGVHELLPLLRGRKDQIAEHPVEHREFVDDQQPLLVRDRKQPVRIRTAHVIADRIDPGSLLAAQIGAELCVGTRFRAFPPAGGQDIAGIQPNPFSVQAEFAADRPEVAEAEPPGALRRDLSGPVEDFNVKAVKLRVGGTP